MNNEKLVVWEPLEKDPFDRFSNEMSFVRMSYGIEFILVFEETITNTEYTFTYKRTDKPLPILTFRFTEEMGRSDIESLIGQLAIEDDNKNSSLIKNDTFYKIEHSNFLNWYDSVFSARDILYPNTEHHLYITSNFFIDVLSEILPEITISTQHI